MERPRFERTKRVLVWVAVLALGAIGGFIAGLASYHNTPPQVASSPTKSIPQPSAHVDEQTYVDNHLNFSLQVPLDWLHRYSAVDNGGSTSFAFQTATSPGGTTKLVFADIFTIYRYGIQEYVPSTCGCTELARNNSVVYAFKIDGSGAALVTPLSTATIRDELINQVTGTFSITN